MRKLLRLSGACAALFIGISASEAANKKDNVINHIAEVMALEKLCSTLERNTMLIAMAATFNGLQSADIAAGGKYHKKLMNLIQEKRESFDGDEQMACFAGKFLYGEDGINVPGLLVEK